MSNNLSSLSSNTVNNNNNNNNEDDNNNTADNNTSYTCNSNGRRGNTYKISNDDGIANKKSAITTTNDDDDENLNKLSKYPHLNLNKDFSNSIVYGSSPPMKVLEPTAIIITKTDETKTAITRRWNQTESKSIQSKPRELKPRDPKYTQSKSTESKTTESKADKLLTKSIKNLRENLTDLNLDQFLKNTLETIMQIERDEYLERLSKPNSDKGNGFYDRAFKSLSNNSMLVKVPRTRNGTLSLNTLELLKISRDKLDQITLSLYQKGLTFEDIRSFLDETFNSSLSPSTISELTKTFHKFREAWFDSPLEEHYLTVFCDVIFVTVKRGNIYSKEGVFLAIGVREDFKRELLVLEINPTEGANNWGEYLTDLRDKRGVRRIDLLVADGLTGLEEELAKVYPLTDFQKCVVHKIRNVLNKIKPKDKGQVAEDLKTLFANFESLDTLDRAYQKLDQFLDKWVPTYPSLEAQLDPKHSKSQIHYYFTYITYHPNVRRLIYTTNSIENLNRQVRKATKNKLSFETPDSLLDYLFMIIKSFEERNYMKYPVTAYKDFQKVTPENLLENKNITQHLDKNYTLKHNPDINIRHNFV